MNNKSQNTCKAITKKGQACKNHPMKNTEYCYIHSFGKFKGIPWFKNPTLHIIITLIITISFPIIF